MIHIKIRLFGAFRKFGNGQEIYLDLPAPISVQDLKKKLAEKLSLNPHGLMEDSVFADETAILNQTTILNHSCIISVLPPVCGG